MLTLYRILSICLVIGLPVLGYTQSLPQISIDIKSAACGGDEGQVSITFQDDEARVIALYDLKGELIDSRSIEADYVEFTDLEPGIYSVKITQQGAAEYVKAVKVLNLAYDEKIKLRTGVVDTSCRNIYRDGWTIFKGSPYTGFQDFDMTDYQSLVVYFFDDKGSNYQTTR